MRVFSVLKMRYREASEDKLTAPAEKKKQNKKYNCQANQPTEKQDKLSRWQQMPRDGTQSKKRTICAALTEIRVFFSLAVFTVSLIKIEPLLFN